MGNIATILFLALIGGIIGWITNVLAIKLIFRPINPIRIPILNIEILGLIPKRRGEIAQNIGEIVQNELISLDEIVDEVLKEEDKDRIVQYIKLKINNVIRDKMPVFIPSTFKELIQGYLDDIVEQEISATVTDLSEELVNRATDRINIQKMIEDKINELDLEKLEDIILSIAKKELKHIEVLGLILGFLIGIIQGLVVMFI
jgi:uncharacterized membrane protein YheB (UPF0754 family)